MKNQLRNLLVLVVSLFVVQIASAVQEIWQGVSGTSATTNWSDTANWSGAASPAGNDLVFNGTGSVGAAGINNVVDQNFTVTSLLFTNTTGQYHTTLIPSGVTLTDSGVFKVGYLTNDNYQTSVAITGGGTLIVNGTLFYVGMCGSSSGTTGVATNDMSGLSNFVYNASSGQWVIAENGGGSATARGAGILNLAGFSNNITVGTINFNTGGGNNSGFHSLMQFGGGTNILNVGTFNVCSTKSKYATVQFNPSAPASAGLRLRGVNGNTDDSSRATITLGDRNNTGADITEGLLLLKGHPVDIKAGTLTIGQDRSGSGTSVHGGQGVLQFDTGTVDATTINMGVESTAATAASATGMVMVAGSGQLIIGSGGLSLANKSGGGVLAMGALVITNGGTVICSNNISKAATANTIGTIVMSNGVLRVDGAIGSVTTPIDVFSVSNSILRLSIPNDSSPSANVSILNIGGSTNKINIGSIDGTILGYPTTFQVIKYDTANGTNVGGFNFGIGTLPAGGYTGFISNDVANSAVVLVITGGPAPPRSITWSGHNADAGNAITSVWDSNITKDWLSNSTAVFYNDNGGLGGDIVTFDDTAGTSTVTLAATLAPTAIIVTNNTLNYTINDNNNGYALTGDGSLTKRGTGKLTLDNAGGIGITGGMDIEDGGIVQIGKNDAGGGLGTGPVVNNGSIAFNRNNNVIVSNLISGAGGILVSNQTSGTSLQLNAANTFDGDIYVVSGVTLIPANNTALGSTNGGTVLANGATLDVKAPGLGANGLNLNGERVTVSGTGVDSVSGAIINTGTTNQQNVLQRVTLVGNTTFGGSARWDIRGAGASLNTGNNPYTLTKVGVNQVSFVGAAVDAALGDVNVQQGILSVETTSTGLGNANSNLVVSSGATLQVYSLTNQLNKKITLNGDGTVTTLNGGGNSTIDTIIGPMTLDSSVGAVIVHGDNNNRLTLSNAITGTGSLVKTGTNSTLVLTGPANDYSGETIVNDGTLLINGINGGSQLTENISASSLPSGTVVLGGNGTNASPVDIEDVLHPGAAGQPSTLTLGNGPGNHYADTDGTLRFGYQGNGTPTAIFDLGSSTNAGGGVNDLVVVNGDLDANFATIKINPLSVLNTSGPYTLLTYNGSKATSFNGTVHTTTSSRYGFTLNYPPGAVTLSVSGGPVLLTWNNNANTGVWDLNSSQNWFNTSSSASDVFFNQDSVLLDDSITTSATPTTTIALSGLQSPSVVTNNSTTNYTIVGPGKITGSTALYKLGSSKLTLLNSNDFTGSVYVLAGTLAVSNNTSAGATTSTVFVANSATFDLSPSTNANALNFGSKAFVVSGNGVGGNGALFNSGTNQQNAFQNVTLTGNTTFGGSARWDIRSPVNTNASATLSTGGNGYKLTKNGTNFIALSSVAVDPALGDIDVTAGTLSIETQTTGLGNTNNKVTVFNGAGLWLWNLTNIISKPITLQAGSLLNNGSGSNTYNGSITVAGDSTMSVTNLGLTLTAPISLTGTLTASNGSPLFIANVVSGTGGLIKVAPGTLTLNANNTYTGNTAINAGTVAVSASGSLSRSTNVVIASGATLTIANNTPLAGTTNITDNGELNVSGSPTLALTLNNGQTLAGTGHITGLLTNNTGAVVFPGGKGAIGTLTVSSLVVLKGTTYMEANNNATSVDQLSCGVITYGGTLVVSNLDNATLTTNSSLQLFSAGSYSGAFAAIVPANPNNDSNLGWDTNSLTVNGTLKVKSLVVGPPPTPHITTIGLSGTTLHVTATNGAGSGQFMLLSSTNVALPLSQWQTNVTGSFDSNGNLNLSTNIINANDGQRFYILKQ